MNDIDKLRIEKYQRVSHINKLEKQFETLLKQLRAKQIYDVELKILKTKPKPKQKREDK